MKKRAGPIFVSFCFSTLVWWSGCSIETFKEFSVSSVSIDKNGIIGTGRRPIEIKFTKEVDPLSVEDTVRVETDSFTGVSITRSVSGNSIFVTPDDYWDPYARFWLIIEKDIQDIYGKNMAEDFYRPFQSTNDILPVSVLLVSPEIENGIVKTPIDTILLAFRSAVNHSSVEKAFSLSPEAKGYFEWTSDRDCSYHLTESLRKNSLYTLGIDDDARDESGYRIAPFTCSFEYFPNQPFPVVANIRSDGLVIFNPDDNGTFGMEGNTVVILYESAEKNSELRIDFSKEVDRASFRDNVRVVPFASWREQWIDNRTVQIYFDEGLDLGRNYEISLNRGIEDRDGLELQYEYIIDIHIDGEYSRFLGFYADVFSDLAVTDIELWSNGAEIDGGVEQVVLDESAEGSVLQIDYDEGLILSPESVEVRLWLPLRFTHPSYVPEINEESLQDSIQLAFIFGGDVFTGAIYAFDWVGSNECIVELRGMGSGYVYGLSLRGGSSGVVDGQANYLQEDIEYFFKVSLVPYL